jgi:RluA family pseudouridine synthase
MAKPREIELMDGTQIPILYEDRSVLALDKPAGWLMVPTSWEKTARNLQLALESSINAGDFWAKSRNIKFLRFVHRLDGDTSGVVLFVKSPGAMRAFSELFEDRSVEKLYLAVVEGAVNKPEWSCTLPIAPLADSKGKMQAVSPSARNVSPETKDAETHFRVLKCAAAKTLLFARPTTGRTHQIRVHLAAEGHPVLGDALYGTHSTPLRLNAAPQSPTLALRAIALAYRDPFTRKTIRIEAPFRDFVRTHGFTLDGIELFAPPERPKKS